MTREVLYRSDAGTASARTAFFRRSVVVASLVAVLSVPLLSVSARGEEAQPDAVREKIRDAKSLINQEAYAAALSILIDAFSLEPSPALMFNIAMCEKALNRHADAVVSFHRFLALEAERPSDSSVLRGLAEDALRELMPLVATVRIVDAPVGANIRIDGQEIGTAPMDKPFYLMPGNHTVTVTKSDFEPFDIDITAAGGATLKVRADLKSALSRILVTCSVPNGRVAIDGLVKGGCPYEDDLEPGLHEVRISALDKKTAVHRVMADVRRTTVLAVELEPIVPMTETTAVVTESPKQRWPLPAAGGILIALGTAGVGVGAYAHSVWQGEVRAADAVTDEISGEIAARELTTADSYDNMGELYDKQSGHVTQAISWRKGVIIGYAVGAALAAVGVGFIAYHVVSRKQEQSHVTVSVHPTGLEVRF